VALSFAGNKNITLVIKGLVGGQGSDTLGIFPVPHY